MSDIVFNYNVDALVETLLYHQHGCINHFFTQGIRQGQTANQAALVLQNNGRLTGGQ